MRGRLINKLTARIGILDETSMAYDNDYLEKTVSRQETIVEIPCQVEDPSWFNMTFGYSGVGQEGNVVIILHWKDLEDRGLIDSNGDSLINIGARLDVLLTNSGIEVRSFPDPPGMYAIEAHESSWGLSAFNTPNPPTRNLLFLMFAPRKREPNVI